MSEGDNRGIKGSLHSLTLFIKWSLSKAHRFNWGSSQLSPPPLTTNPTNKSWDLIRKTKGQTCSWESPGRPLSCRCFAHILHLHYHPLICILAFHTLLWGVKLLLSRAASYTSTFLNNLLNHKILGFPQCRKCVEKAKLIFDFHTHGVCTALMWTAVEFIKCQRMRVTRLSLDLNPKKMTNGHFPCICTLHIFDFVEHVGRMVEG